MAAPPTEGFQTELRAAAIAHVAELERRYGVLPWALIAAGFSFRGQQVLLANRPRGIFWPSQLTTGALSIKTSVPRQGRLARYDDEVGGDAPHFSYTYQGEDAASRDNVMLRRCLQAALPVIYFYGGAGPAAAPRGVARRRAPGGALEAVRGVNRA